MVLANALASAAQNPRKISAYQQEMFLLCRLEHPNIVSCSGIITRDDDGELLMWCVMERLEIDLFNAITNGQLPLGQNNPSQFVGLLASLVSALAYLHSPVSPHTCLFYTYHFQYQFLVCTRSDVICAFFQLQIYGNVSERREHTVG